MTERFALIEPRKPKYDLTMGEGLTDHLVTHNRLPASAFPPIIDLGLYTGVMDELYRKKKNVYVSTPISQQQLHSIVDHWRQNDPLHAAFAGDEEIKKLEKSFLEEMNQQDAGERLTILYKDMTEGKIGTTEITFGDYTSVSNKSLYTLEPNQKVIFQLHTHPHDSPASPSDYFINITGNYTQEAPLANGQLILAPSLQVMTLVTSETPVLSGNAARKLVNTWIRAISRDDEKGHLLEQTTWEQNRETEEKIAVLMRETALLEQHLKTQKHLPRSERRELTRQVEKSIKQFHAQQVQYKRDKDRVIGIVTAYTYGKYIEFARQLNMVMYMSTDRRNFKQFSA